MKLLPQSRKWANSVRLKDFPTLSGLFLPEQSWGKEEERRFSAAKAGFLTFCQHMLPSLLKSSQFRTPANATKALCLAQCSGLHEQGTAAPHTCSCTGLTSAAPHPGKLAGTLCRAALHTAWQHSQKALQNQFLGSKCTKKTYWTSGISHIQNRHRVPLLSQWTLGSTETTLPEGIFHRLPPPTKIQVWFKAVPQLRQKLNDAKPCSRVLWLVFFPELQMSR